MNKVFKEQIGCNMEVYVHDTLVKSRASRNHIDNIKEAFTTLHKYQMKLNPAKRAFGVTLGKFLGFMVFHQEIQSDKCEGSTKTYRRMATLNHFVSKLIERCLPFFQTLKKPKNFRWMDEC